MKKGIEERRKKRRIEGYFSSTEGGGEADWGTGVVALRSMSSIATISAASPGRLRVLIVLVYPPARP